jgi:hypothetical protein
MNNLGGMVFIVAGIALGYWVATGRAVNFLKAINGGAQAQQQGGQGFNWGQLPNSVFGLPTIKPWWMQTVNYANPSEVDNAANSVFNDQYSPGANTAQNTVPWNVIA